MNRILVTAFFSIAAASSALAADLPQPAPPPQAPAVYIPTVAPVYNWGGIYVGINGGWGFGKANWDAGVAGAFTGLAGSTNDNGGVVGGTVGFNLQWDAFVVGLEGDWDYSGINTGSTATVCSNFGTCQTGNNWLGTVRARVGWAADRVLFYGTGGAAFGSIQTTYSSVQSTTTQTGWTAGAGVEWAFADNWTARVEYLYVDLGSWHGNCSTTACTAVSTGPAIPVSVSLTESLVRAGVDFKFR
jgi:outer membrane immunogenic protein